MIGREFEDLLHGYELRLGSMDPEEVVGILIHQPMTH
jgi:hypothetical protein